MTIWTLKKKQAAFNYNEMGDDDNDNDDTGNDYEDYHYRRNEFV
jgi:hypothetical protein